MYLQEQNKPANCRGWKHFFPFCIVKSLDTRCATHLWFPYGLVKVYEYFMINQQGAAFLYPIQNLLYHSEQTFSSQLL